MRAPHIDRRRQARRGPSPPARGSLSRPANCTDYTAATNPEKQVCAPQEDAKMDLEPNGGGANARSTHRAKGPGRARAAPASPEGAWAVADDTAAAFATSRAFQPLAGRRSHHCVGRGPVWYPPRPSPCVRWPPKRRRRPPSGRRPTCRVRVSASAGIVLRPCARLSLRRAVRPWSWADGPQLARAVSVLREPPSGRGENRHCH